jgi:hypothetical protein
MSWGKLAGNVIGTAIVLGVTKKGIIDPLFKKKKKKKGSMTYEEMFGIK